MPGVEQRRRPDRRFFRRGGRRPTDVGGFSPLVMVVESNEARRTITETLLASSHFAVAPVATIESALSICRGLAPSVIVCDAGEETRVRAGLKPRDIPIVGTNIERDALDHLVDRIRAAVRGQSGPSR
jgi:CheY-like chemotaxis protein